MTPEKAYRDLADRVEGASAEEQREWLEQAFYAINPAPECGTDARHAWVALSNRFHDLMATRAFLDAAMTLIDRLGVLLHLSDIGADGLPYCNIGCSETAREFKGVGAATLAMVVTAAALRAHAARIGRVGE